MRADLDRVVEARAGELEKGERGATGRSERGQVGVLEDGCLDLHGTKAGRTEAAAGVVADEVMVAVGREATFDQQSSLTSNVDLLTLHFALFSTLVCSPLMSVSSGLRVGADDLSKQPLAANRLFSLGLNHLILDLCGLREATTFPSTEKAGSSSTSPPNSRSPSLRTTAPSCPMSQSSSRTSTDSDSSESQGAGAKSIRLSLLASRMAPRRSQRTGTTRTLRPRQKSERRRLPVIANARSKPRQGKAGPGTLNVSRTAHRLVRVFLISS